MSNINIKEELKKIIDTNSRFIRHIKDNVVLVEKTIGNYDVYYTGQQGWSEKFHKWDKSYRLNSGKKSEILKKKDSFGNKYSEKEKRVYVDFIERISEKTSYDDDIPNNIEIRKVIENKQALSAIRFSKRLDDAFINGICQVDNFNPKAITKSKVEQKDKLGEFIKWTIDNTSKMINIDKNKEYTNYKDKDDKHKSHGSFAVDASELFLIVNQSLMNEIRLKEIFKEIELTSFFKELTIIDAELPNNFEAVLINKRALWYYYKISNAHDFTDPSIENDKVYLTIEYQLGLIPFVGACAFVKE
jgi:hypothetical protein